MLKLNNCFRQLSIAFARSDLRSGQRLIGPDLNEPSPSSAFSRDVKKQKLEFRTHSGNLALVRKFVLRFLEAYPFSEKERMLMVLGVDEACTNIMRYAYESRDHQLIVLSTEGLRSRVRIRLRDYGKQAKKRALQGRSYKAVKPGGLGLYLIRRAFDKVDYILKRRGTELVLTKNLDFALRVEREKL